MCVRDADIWRVELSRRHGALAARDVLVIEQQGVTGPVGLAAHHTRLLDGLVSLEAFELSPGHSWLEPTAALAAHFHQWLQDQPDGPGRGVRLWLPDGHPALRCLATRLGRGPASSYGQYVRVPDVVAFIDRARPALERRLAESPAVGWTGTLTIDLYTYAVQLVFDAGQLTSVSRQNPPESADVSLPAEAFLHLLFGNRSLEEIERTVADSRVGTDAGALLVDALFPPMPYSSWELG